MMLSSRSKMSVLVSAIAFLTIIGGFMAAGALRGAVPHAHAKSATEEANVPFCARAQICADSLEQQQDGEYYVGHDEPSLLFYSNTPGSGNSYTSKLTLPTDPPTLPKQDGTGGTFNFQLHPAFWYGMAMCDNQSAPEFTSTCTPNSDSNIFDSSNPEDPNYIGKHPGGAFMEMQFYPPGWVKWPNFTGCDATQWCAALNIDSFIENQNTGQFNNLACREVVGDEPVNFAFVTTNGVSQAPANPVSFQTNPAVSTPDPAQDLFMNSGDTLLVNLHDTSDGFQVVINDLTRGTSGSMTASAANGFGQIKFDPNGHGCTVIPNDFHPMYSTSSEHTRLTWTAHSYNVAFSDEIGHFEYCNAIDGEGGSCTADGVHDTDATLDGFDDDIGCFDGAASSRIQITGCTFSDEDFDGVPYQLDWPGTSTNQAVNAQLYPQPIKFTGLLINGTQAYDRVAFENDLPRIEFDTIPPCQRHVANPADPNPGAGCVDPPAGAAFYPFYSAHSTLQGCLWELGGAHIPGGLVNNFGGTPTAEYGGLLLLAYPSTGFQPTLRFNDFRQVLSSNPC